MRKNGNAHEAARRKNSNESGQKKKSKNRGLFAGLFHLLAGTPHAALDTTFALGAAGAVGAYAYHEGSSIERARRAIEVSPAFQEEIRNYMDLYDRPGTEEDKVGRSLEHGEQRVLHRFGLLRYRGFESRIDYIRNNLFKNEEARGTLSETITEELSYIAVGMAAQESEFNNAAQSEAGATRLFQFMPSTEAEYEAEGELDLTYLTDQVTAVEQYFRNAYARLLELAGDDLEHIRRTYYTKDENGEPLSEEESRRLLEATFIPLVLANAFNAGPDRMAEVLEHTAEDLRTFASETPVAYVGPYDVYVEMARSARGNVRGYGPHASEYALRSFALAVLINEPTETNTSQ